MSFWVSRGPGNFEIRPLGPGDSGDRFKMKFQIFEIFKKMEFQKILKWGLMGPIGAHGAPYGTHGAPYGAPGPLQGKAATPTKFFFAHLLTKIDTK